MSATELPEQFAEAAQNWHLEKLYADLGKAKKIWAPHKKRGLSNVEKEYLRGLLCGHSPDEIAKQLLKDLSGVRKALAITIYRYVEVLAERPTNSLGNWRDVEDWLEEEYKIPGSPKFIFEPKEPPGISEDDRIQSVDPTLPIVPRDGAPDISGFQGRARELAELKTWIVEDGCRLAAMLGMGGIGKSSLAAKLVEEIKDEFECVIWRSLGHAPLFPELVGDLMQCLFQNNLYQAPARTGQRAQAPDRTSPVFQLMAVLGDRRCLLVLDDLEMVMGSGQLAGQDLAGHYRPGYEDYGEFLKQVAASPLRSCLLVASREKPIEISALAGDSVRCQELGGLDLGSAKGILADRGFSPSVPGVSELIQLYKCHPAALKIAATTIEELFDRNISLFLSQSTLMVGDVLGQLLSQQFQRLSELEKEIIYWLAIESASISLSELQKRIWYKVSGTDLVAALESLRRRSLIEKIAKPAEDLPADESQTKEPQFVLHPIVRKYVLNQFVRVVCEDIFAVLDTGEVQRLGCLRSHALVSDRSPAEIQAIQKRTILARVIDKLPSILTGSASAKEQLEQILCTLADQSPERLGYARSNLHLLLAALEAGCRL